MVESIGPQDAADRDLEERYRTLEEAYAAQHWSHVIRLGENLLGSLKGSKGLAFELRPRTQVLIAHAYLYGLNDRDAAEDLYGAVISSRCDPALRQIAAEGLKACNRPLQGRGQAQDPGAQIQGSEAQPSPTLQAPQPEPHPDPQAYREPQSTTATAMPPAKPTPGTTAGTNVGSAPAMPWLAQAAAVQLPGAPPAGGSNPGDAPWLSSPTPAAATPEKLIPEVIEEPELIEVHQADPALADRVDLTITAPNPQLPPAQESGGQSLALDRLVAKRPPPETGSLAGPQAWTGSQTVLETGAIAVADPILLDDAPMAGAIGKLDGMDPEVNGGNPSWPNPLDLDSLPSLGNPIDDPVADLASGLLRVVIR
jgi:hypothetical protein